MRSNPFRHEFKIDWIGTSLSLLAMTEGDCFLLGKGWDQEILEHKSEGCDPEYRFLLSEIIVVVFSIAEGEVFW